MNDWTMKDGGAQDWSGVCYRRDKVADAFSGTARSLSCIRTIGDEPELKWSSL